MVLLVGECACGGRKPRAAQSDRAPAGATGSSLRIAAEAAAAAALAAAVLASASLGIPAGLATLTLGLVATVSLLALVAGLVARR